jgi:K+-transporting ATPase KdpF subunit
MLRVGRRRGEGCWSAVRVENDVANIVGLVLAVVLIGYLLYTLVKPEKF